jgi:DNA-directed RNA polymerase subunit B
MVNEALVRRRGFAGSLFVTARTDRKKKEVYGVPDPARCARLKPGANYSKLTGSGFPEPGTIIEQGDAVIGRIGSNTGPDHEKWPEIDASSIWGRDESARVVVSDEGNGAVCLEVDRELGVGDKTSSRAGNKGITATLISPADIPFTEDGAVAGFIVNPHSFPTRMILGQIMEATISSAHARLGTYGDGTAWAGMSIEKVANLALKAGLTVKNGRQLSDPFQGIPLQQQTHVGVTYEQRLLKFAMDERYAAPASGPKDPVTGQPVPGKAAGGAVRLGEMEGWTLMVHGNPGIMQEKMWQHSDGLHVPHCRRCGVLAVHNESQRHFTCPRCKDAADLAVTYSRRSAVAFEHEVGSVVDYRVHPRPRSYMA